MLLNLEMGSWKCFWGHLASTTDHSQNVKESWPMFNCFSKVHLLNRGKLEDYQKIVCIISAVFLADLFLQMVENFLLRFLLFVPSVCMNYIHTYFSEESDSLWLFHLKAESTLMLCICMLHARVLLKSH
jgi:hypothetical protein